MEETKIKIGNKLVNPEDLPLPTTEQRKQIDERLEDLVKSITNHPQWGGPGIDQVHPTLYEVWDFVNRSRYKLSEFSNIQKGKEVALPDQFTPPVGKGDKAALKVFQDVCSRTLMMRLLITDQTGNAAILTNAPSDIDFGDECRRKLEMLEEVIPEWYMTAGFRDSSMLDWIDKVKRVADGGVN